MKKLFVLILSAVTAISMAGCMPKSLDEVAQNAGSSVTANNEGSGAGYAEDGYAEGFIGDTTHTYFLDFTINSAYTGTTFDGLVPPEGYKFVAAEAAWRDVAMEFACARLPPMRVSAVQNRAYSAASFGRRSPFRMYVMGPPRQRPSGPFSR